MAQTETGGIGDAKPLTAGKTPLLNKEIKDTVFSDLFSSKKNLLALYRVCRIADIQITSSLCYTCHRHYYFNKRSCNYGNTQEKQSVSYR